LNTF